MKILGQRVVWWDALWLGQARGVVEYRLVHSGEFAWRRIEARCNNWTLEQKGARLRTIWKSPLRVERQWPIHQDFEERARRCLVTGKTLELATNPSACLYTGQQTYNVISISSVSGAWRHLESRMAEYHTVGEDIPIKGSLQEFSIATWLPSISTTNWS